MGTAERGHPRSAFYGAAQGRIAVYTGTTNITTWIARTSATVTRLHRPGDILDQDPTYDTGPFFRCGQHCGLSRMRVIPDNGGAVLASGDYPL